MAEGSFEVTAVPDCLMIAKAFERGASYSPTEGATFALMTPILSTSRIHAKGINNQIETAQALTALQTSQQKIQSVAPNATGLTMTAAANLRNLDKAKEGDEGIFTKVKGSFLPAQGQVAAGSNAAVNSEIFGNIFNSKCIPCGDRINMAGELDFKAGIKGYLKNYFQYWKEWLTQHLKQLMDLLTNFKGAGSFIDLCALIKMLKESFCVPDLARMLSALMALMANINFDFNGIFDLILQLAAPLLQPFLSNFVNMLQKYILLIIAPLECIIRSIQGLLAKLDYNVLFQNINSVDKNFGGIGRRGGQEKGELRYLGFVPETFGGDNKLHAGPRTGRVFGVETGITPTSFNPLDAATGGAIKQENEENRRAVEAARQELSAVQNASTQVNASDPSSVERYNQQLETAREKYSEAQDEQNLSEIGQINKKLSTFTNNFKSALFSLIQKLREAAQKVEAFFKDIFDELKKLMGEYFGGGSSMAQLIASKLEVIQLIAIITQIIQLFSRNLNCDDDEKDIKVERLLPQQANLKIWTDEQGQLHIEEDPEVIRRAVDQTVKAFGVKPRSLGGAGNAASNTAQADRGENPTELTPRQKLESLIEFTGDPVLDSSISRVTEALTTPVNVVFKCPLQTSVQNAEQVNKWISELNTA